MSALPIAYRESWKRPSGSQPYKRCSRCGLYFSGMIHLLAMCPYCNAPLRSRRTWIRRVDPRAYGVDPYSREVSEERVIVNRRGEAEGLEDIAATGR